MKKTIQQLTWGIALSVLHFSAQAQCPVITCMPAIAVSTDPAMCDAIVNYTLPIAADPCGGGTPVSQTFTYTGAQQTFTVPAGVTSITVDAYGAQGGTNSPSTNINYGGYVQATVAVTPGSTIYVYVGEQPTGLTGGFNGGGNGETLGKGGGGASDIRIGGTALTDRVVVAGAGGGGGYWNAMEVHGGLGGGLIGGNGWRIDYASNPGGDGGTQTSSGNGTCASFNNPVCAGGFGFGGSPTGCGCEVYGGGGGWYGGGGSGNCRGGAGGSSYTIPSATSVTHTQGVRIGNGEVTLSWVGAGPAPTVTQNAGLPPGSAFPVGTTINVFQTISGGVTTTCSIEVVVSDNEDPTIVCNGNIQLCEGDVFAAGAPVTSDNCGGVTLAYACTGATTASGTGSVDGLVFNLGTSVVTYTVSDAAGNTTDCSFEVLVTPLPATLIDEFDPNVVCSTNPAIPLPVATPPLGSYSGTGVSGLNFDPALSGVGTFTITYTSTDNFGCTNSASTTIQVDDCSSVDEINALSNVIVFPNPSNGLFTISFGQDLGQVDYAIFTMDGKTVQTGTTASASDLNIDLRKERKGSYLLQLSSGSLTQTMTLIKE